MPFVKGQSGNTKGKPKGVRSEKTLVLETFCQDIIEGGMLRFNEAMNKLAKEKPEKYIDSYLALLEYVKPKLARQDVNIDAKGELSIKWIEEKSYIEPKDQI